MRIVTKRKADKSDIESWMDWIATPDGWIEGLTSTDGQPTHLYDYQRAIITDESPAMIGEKSRRVGWSLVRSLRALANCHLQDESENQIISLNLKECRRKIRYARRAWESLPTEWRQPLTVDNRLELEFANGSWIASVFNPRGEGGNVDIDEMAQLAEDRQKEIHIDAMPCITRGGQIAIGSTPMGKSGRFYEIASEHEGKYAEFRKYKIYWWDCPDLSINSAKARLEAPAMTTQGRVERFATARLRLIFDNMPLEDFQQEYELLYVDETTAFFPYELILPATDPAPEIYESIIDLAEHTTGVLYGGYDVGRKRNTSELTINEVLGDRHYERYFETFDKTKFQVQQAALENTLMILGPRLMRLSIDQNGIGMMLAENLHEKFGTRVEPVILTNPSKAEIANRFRIGLEKSNIRLYPDRDRIAHLHSIKKILLPGGSVRFDTLRNEKHHADKAWSQMLAHWAAVNPEGVIHLGDIDAIGCGREAAGAWGGYL